MERRWGAVQERQEFTHARFRGSDSAWDTSADESVTVPLRKSMSDMQGWEQRGPSGGRGRSDWALF